MEVPRPHECHLHRHVDGARGDGYLRAGDTLVVPSLDRLSRSLQDLIQIVADLRRTGIGFRSLKESIDTTTAGCRLIFHVFAALRSSSGS